MKHDALTMALFYDYYGELLTEKQRTCFDLYYNQDLSLSEIAEDLGVTRQGVHDTLARAEAQLRDFEEKTGCIAREEAVRAASSRARRLRADRSCGPCAAGRSGRRRGRAADPRRCGQDKGVSNGI